MKILRWSVFVILYVLIGWATALHQFRHGDWEQGNGEAFDLSSRQIFSTFGGVIWPICGLFVWSDVYLWEADRPKAQSSMIDTLEYGESIMSYYIVAEWDSFAPDTIKAVGEPLNPLEGK